MNISGVQCGLSVDNREIEMARVTLRLDAENLPT